ncbi:hypothetical protein ACQCLI_15100 [Pseudomonas nitroreducens]|uniref:hypothetical protein n=1 Tax=Pseudomonas nitroreducens TaxID=46680 RepID=UPI00036A7EB7|nr:hypothetical protein [Pseudomonas nitroreducens]
MSGKKDERVFVINSVSIHPETPPEVQKYLADKEAAKANAGAMLGGLIILIGVLTLFGTYSWEPITVLFQSAGLSTKLTQACPGTFISLLGLVIVVATRFKFSHTSN